MELQYGIVDDKGNEIIKCIYDELNKIHDGHFIAKRGSKYGVIDSLNNLLIDCNYTGITNFQEDLLLAENYDKKEYIFFDKSFKEKIKLNVESCGEFSDGMSWIQKDGNFGYINSQGEIIIECQFYECGNFKNGNAWVKNAKNEFALIDKKGQIVVDYFYAEDILDFRKVPFKSNHAIIVSRNDNNLKQYDLLEKNASIENGQPAVFNEEAFDGVRLFENNTAIVKNLGKWYIFDLEEAIIIGDAFDLITDDQLKYEELVEPFQNCDIAFALLDGKAGIINQKGKLITDFNFDIFRPFKNGYACVGVKNGITELWGIIDDSGKLICDIKYTNVTNFNELYACVCKKISTSYKWGFIDKNGNEVSDFIYLNSAKFSESKCCIKIEVQNSIHWHLIDNKFNIIQITEFDENYEIGAFNDGIAKITNLKNEKSGYINTAAKLITKIQYDTYKSYSFSKESQIVIVAK